MDRRKFLSILLSVFDTGAFVSFAYPLIRYLAPPTPDVRTARYTFKKSDISDAKEILFQETPTIIINRPGKGYIALSRVCTHLGCLLEYDKSQRKLVCPCHAGIFDLEGRVVSGPPPKPLLTFPLRVEGEDITIG
jgi:cytochrome b6-f complex iron-sulfur subunit